MLLNNHHTEDQHAVLPLIGSCTVSCRVLSQMHDRQTYQIIKDEIVFMSDSSPLYFPGKTLSKEKLRMSLLPDRGTALLSPCRLTGCRVTERSSQDASGQPEEHNVSLCEK